jgi:hypothetical protein
MKTRLVTLLLVLTAVNIHNTAEGNTQAPRPPVNPTYYLLVEDFVNSMVAVQTGVPAELAGNSANLTTVDSSYIYGRAPLYRGNSTNGVPVGTCAASFMNSQDTNNRVYSAISNFISTDDGMIVSWFTPTFLSNLELDSLVNGMVTKCRVACNTLIGKTSPYYGKRYTLEVSSSDGKIWFRFKRIP